MVLCRSGSFGLENARYPFGLSLSKPGLVRWFGRCACVECGGRVVAPAGDSLFFASPKKSKQKKGDPQSATPSLCEGANLRRGGGGLRGAPWIGLGACGAPLGHPRGVSSRSMGASPPMLTPQPPRRRRSQQGRDSRTSKHPHGPLLRSAACAQRVAFAPARWGRAQRSEAMARVDVRSPGSLLCVPRSAGQGVCACAEGHTHFVH